MNSYRNEKIAGLGKTVAINPLFFLFGPFCVADRRPFLEQTNLLLSFLNFKIDDVNLSKQIDLLY